MMVPLNVPLTGGRIGRKVLSGVLSRGHEIASVDPPPIGHRASQGKATVLACLRGLGASFMVSSTPVRIRVYSHGEANTSVFHERST